MNIRKPRKALTHHQCRELEHAWIEAARRGRPLNRMVTVRALGALAPLDHAKLVDRTWNKLGVWSRYHGSGFFCILVRDRCERRISLIVLDACHVLDQPSRRPPTTEPRQPTRLRRARPLLCFTRVILSGYVRVDRSAFATYRLPPPPMAMAARTTAVVSFSGDLQMWPPRRAKVLSPIIKVALSTAISAAFTGLLASEDGARVPHQEGLPRIQTELALRPRSLP